MRIYVLGSNSFVAEMVACKDRLIALGYNGWIHPDYEAFVKGEKLNVVGRGTASEEAAVKKAGNYLKAHYQHILESDAILIVNDEKHGIPNYIGGNVLIEMGQAFVNNKPIFLLNGLPLDSAYQAEIESMDPICLHGDLRNIAHSLATP